MPRCRYCGLEILWQQTSRGTRPMNPDGTPHHRTCRVYHAIKRAERLERASLPPRGDPAPVECENPNQMHFAF